MLVTVLFSTRNRSRRLELTLEKLGEIQVPHGVGWEVVVTDNGSCDATPDLLARWRRRLPLRSVRVERPGLSIARNAALELARGDLILFTDDDVRVSPGWLAEYVAAYLEGGRKHYYGGPIDCEFEGPAPGTEWLRYAPPSVRGLNWGPVARRLRPREYFIGPNWACAADLVRQAGGFDVRMGLGAAVGPQGGEEIELMERLQSRGLSGWYVPGARLSHWVPAEKTRDAHIKARWQMLATVVTWKRRTTPDATIPWRVYTDLVLSQFRRLAARLGLHDRVAAEMHREWCLGVYAGFRLPPRIDSIVAREGVAAEG